MTTGAGEKVGEDEHDEHDEVQAEIVNIGDGGRTRRGRGVDASEERDWTEAFGAEPPLERSGGWILATTGFGNISHSLLQPRPSSAQGGSSELGLVRLGGSEPMGSFQWISAIFSCPGKALKKELCSAREDRQREKSPLLSLLFLSTFLRLLCCPLPRSCLWCTNAVQADHAFQPFIPHSLFNFLSSRFSCQ